MPPPLHTHPQTHVHTHTHPSHDSGASYATDRDGEKKGIVVICTGYRHIHHAMHVAICIASRGSGVSCSIDRDEGEKKVTVREERETRSRCEKEGELRERKTNEIGQREREREAIIRFEIVI
ncbi:Hypothetical predicted protein [Olea europaea subsp. europaea]|uniref:Uncharacterized protein n=1 Tax=Olea europaea subsp. europaea TaxID=158383 RepID=A0A8S0UCI5_OLEEU|nr:Hypothetical predicted protein [Olea europaea subsp. europaea]